MLDAQGRWVPPYPTAFRWRWEATPTQDSDIQFLEVGFDSHQGAADHVTKYEAIGSKGQVIAWPTMMGTDDPIENYLLASWPFVHGLPILPSLIHPLLTDAMTWAMVQGALLQVDPQTGIAADPRGFDRAVGRFKTYFNAQLTPALVDTVVDPAKRQALRRAHALTSINYDQYLELRDPTKEP